MTPPLRRRYWPLKHPFAWIFGHHGVCHVECSPARPLKTGMHCDDGRSLEAEHMFGRSLRRKREERTIERMIRIYCSGRHNTDTGLCPECEGLLRYALERIDRCPLKGRKTTCARCTIHCYAPAMRQRIREVMRYAGPRMAYTHPLLTLLHLFDGLRLRGSSNIKEE